MFPSNSHSMYVIVCTNKKTIKYKMSAAWFCFAVTNHWAKVELLCKDQNF